MAFSRRDFLQIIASIPMLPGFLQRKIETPHTSPRPGMLVPEEVKGSFAADHGSLLMPQRWQTARTAERVEATDSFVGMLLQRPSFQYQQIVQIWRPEEKEASGESPGRLFYLGGRTHGMLSVARMIAPTAVVQEFRIRYGNLEQLDNRPLRLEIPFDGEKIQYELRGCCLAGQSVSVYAADMTIVESVQILFQQMFMPDGEDVFGPPTKEFKFPFAGMQSCPQ